MLTNQVRSGLGECRAVYLRLVAWSVYTCLHPKHIPCSELPGDNRLLWLHGGAGGSTGDMIGQRFIPVTRSFF